MKKLVSAAPATVTTTIALLLGLLGLLGLSVAAPAADAAPRTAHTAVTVRVTGCEGCQVAASSWVHLRDSSWHSVTRTVRHGKVTFFPPTDRTHGLALTVTDRRAVNDGAVPIAVLRYAGKAAGADVTARRASHGRAGFDCWNGTKAARATLRLTVDRFPGVGLTGDHGYSIRAYGDPGVATIGTRRALHRGVLETQDQPLCFG